MTTKGFNNKLFDYYLEAISENPDQIEDMRSRLFHVEVDDDRVVSLTQKVLDSPKTIDEIKKHIENFKTAVLRCYNPTETERRLALKVGIPLFAPRPKFDFAGTKSGSRRIFKLAKTNVIPGYNYLKNPTEMSLAMAKLMRDYPDYEKLVVKLDKSASGRGNSIFAAKRFLTDHMDELTSKRDIEKVARYIRKDFCKYTSFQLAGQNCEEYLKEYSREGGIVELYIPGEIKYSPSSDVVIEPGKEPRIIQTIEQVLGGPDKQKYLGCLSPSKDSHRQLVVKETKKIAKWMAKQGMIGNFGIDFIVSYSKEGEVQRFHPIEINLRKGGATHPYNIAYYLTGAKYSRRQNCLLLDKKPVYYLGMDIIEHEGFTKMKPEELVNIVKNSPIHFDRKRKKGVFIYMPGTIKKYGRFGAVCIGGSEREVKKMYEKLIVLITDYSSKK